MIVVITKGSHQRNPHVSPGPRQFAHRWDVNDPEDVPHQANNFRTYATALGDFQPPIVLLRPENSDAHDEVNLSDWKSIVETGTGLPVEIR